MNPPPVSGRSAHTAVINQHPPETDSADSVERRARFGPVVAELVVFGGTTADDRPTNDVIIYPMHVPEQLKLEEEEEEEEQEQSHHHEQRHNHDNPRPKTTIGPHQIVVNNGTDDAQAQIEPRFGHSAVTFESSLVMRLDKSDTEKSREANDIDTYMFVFGGQGKGNRVLGDLWRFSCATRVWRRMEPVGNVSSAHAAGVGDDEKHESTGAGGHGAAGPAARTKHCAVAMDIPVSLLPGYYQHSKLRDTSKQDKKLDITPMVPVMLVYGGWDAGTQTAFSDLWAYAPSVNRWYELPLVSVGDVRDNLRRIWASACVVRTADVFANQTQSNPNGDAPPRQRASKKSSMIVYAGEDHDSFLQSDMYALTPDETGAAMLLEKVVPSDSPDGTPPDRFGQSCCVFSASLLGGDCMLLTGGFAGEVVGDVWVYSFRVALWRQLRGLPAGDDDGQCVDLIERFGHVLIADQRHSYDAIVVQGQTNMFGRHDDIILIDGLRSLRRELGKDDFWHGGSKSGSANNNDSNCNTNEWACAVCTFINKSSASICAMCTSPK